MQSENRTPKISIIIPVYNRKGLLVRCTNSLIAQTFKEFEVCIVDDGSTDGSEKLCDELAEKDARIRVQHIENGGAAHARHKGVEQARGEWILFVDSDDTLPADALQRLFKTSSEDTDIVIGFFRKKRLWGKCRFSAKNYRKRLIEGRHNISAACGKLFRHTLFDKQTLEMPSSIVMGEDMLMNLRLAFASSKPVRLVKGEPVYNYVQHGENITHTFKLTPHYEHIFHQERLRSIPSEAHLLYMPAMIHRRLRMLKRLLRQAQRQNNIQVLQTSPFVKELLSDIRTTHYSFFQYPNLKIWHFLAKAAKGIE